MAFGPNTNITTKQIDIARYTTAPSEKAAANIVRKPVVIPNNYASSHVRHSLAPVTPVKQSTTAPAANIVKKPVDMANQNGGLGKLSHKDIFDSFKLNLAEFMKNAGVLDPSWVEIQNNGKTFPIKDFVGKSDPDNLLKTSNKLKELSKDTNVLRQAHSITGENKSRLAKDAKATLMKVVVDITPVRSDVKTNGPETAKAEKVDAGIQVAATVNISDRAVEKMLASLQDKKGGKTFAEILKA